MWENYWLSALGSFLQRKNSLFFVAGLLSALFVATANSTVVFADSATWEGDTIKYQGKTYTKMENPPLLPSISPSNPVIYQSQDGDNVSIIALSDDSDKSREITDAQVATFKKDEGNNYSGIDPPGPLTIAATEANGGPATIEGQTSCSIEGIGWIICPVSRFIAGSMDRIYGWISEFLTVKPLTTDTSSGLFEAWKIALGFANTAFILAFLLIIYSHITSYGISNYEIKKMVPKLIIVAILVNVSYTICALAVDVSNILGDSVQQAFVQIRESLPEPAPQIEWGALTNYILSAGTLAGGLLGTFAAIANYPALVGLLFPVLVMGVLSILVALIVLAARQALIIVLVVLAPLAFVAYLLPNTEKLFEKWRGLFMTMLLVFPLFSLLFGGSQLAASIILQSTDQISVVILALFVQVAPLALTPFLIKFSGSLLGRLAGMVNNPQKGLVDRTRNWANDRADLLRKQQMANGRNKSRFTPGGYAYRRESNKQFREARKKQLDTQLESARMGEDRYQQIMSLTKQSEYAKATGEARAEAMYEEAKHTSPTMRSHSATQWLEKQRVKQYHAHEEALQHEALTNKITPQTHPDNYFASSSDAARTALRAQKIAEGRSMFAQSEQSDEWAKLVISNENLQTQIGGVGGKDRALAHATSAFRKNYGERIGEGKAVLDHWNLSGDQRQAHALGNTIEVDDGYGNLKIFRKDSTYTREAAVDFQVRNGTAQEIEDIFKVSGSDLREYRTTISQAAAEAGVSKKLIYAGGQTIDNLAQGNIVGDAGLDDMARATIMKGKIGAADLSTNEALGLKRLLDVARTRPPADMSATDRAILAEEIAAMKKAAYIALTNPSLKGNVKQNSRVELNKMIKDLGGEIRDDNGNIITIDPNREY